MNTDTVLLATHQPKPRSRRWRLAAFVAAALITLIALFYAVEDWRGRRAWEQCQQELKAKGEQLDWAAYIPTRIPDDQNFVKTPLLEAIGYRGQVDTNAWAPIAKAASHLVWTAWGDWQSGCGMNWTECQSTLRRSTNLTLPPLPQSPAADLLFALQSITPQLAELRAASLKPRAQFDFDRTTPFEEGRFFNFVALRSLSQILAFHACAELELSRPEQAFADVRAIHRLADALENETTLVATMIRVALRGLALQPFWDGWAKNQWNESELEEFQRSFAHVDLLPELAHSLRAERAGINALVTKHALTKREPWRVTMRSSPAPLNVIDQLCQSIIRLEWHMVPRGWIYQNLTVYSREMQHMLPAGLTRQPAIVSGAELELLKQDRQANTHSGVFEFLSAVAIPHFSKATETVARTQVFLNQAQIVCALERYRKAHGQYPEALTQLVPKFIEKLPIDVITGGPLQYRRTEPGRFTLYSVGWNEKDDGGVTVMNEDKVPTPDFCRGDWVWMWPVK